MSASQRLALAVLLTANFTLAVDFSILNVALPHIGGELGFTTGALQWIVTSFALCAAGFTLLFGRVADLFGRKRLFLLGIALLGAASLVGGLATEPTLLLVARVGQGLATAMVTPAALSLMTTTFPEGPARSRVLGLNGALMAAGFTAGAVLGGLLTGAVSWRWAFFINVAVAAAVLVVAPFVLQSAPADTQARLDMPGAITVTAGLVALVFGIDKAGRAGWANAGAWGPIAGAGVLFVLFWATERRAAQPLVDLSMLRRRNIAWGNAAGVLAFGTFTSLVFLLTLYLQQVLDLGAISTGAVLGVLGLGTVIGGLVAPKIIGRIGPKKAIVTALVIQGLTTAPLALANSNQTWVITVMALTFVGGVANLVAIVGYTVASTATVPPSQQGLATGLVTMSQQIGITLGTPVMSAILASQLGVGLLPGLKLAAGANAAIAIASAVLIAAALQLPKTEPAA